MSIQLSPINLTALIILGLLLIATTVVFVISKLKPNSNFQELKQRIISWWVMIGFFLLALLINPQYAIILFAFLSFLALKEYFTLIHTRFEDHRVLFWSYLAIPLQYWWVYSEWKAMFLVFIPVYSFLFNPLRLILVGEPKGIINSMSRIQWGLMAFVFCISHVAGLLLLPETPFIAAGPALLLYLVFLTEINDIAQFCWGKLLGKHKIVPTISPNKTWEGFIGGLFTTVCLSIAFSFLSKLTIIFSIYSGLLIGASGFIGDVVMSALKRDIGVKDASNLIPGHGGIIDRIDSLIYTAPLFFHLVSYFFHHAPVGCSLK